MNKQLVTITFANVELARLQAGTGIGAAAILAASELYGEASTEKCLSVFEHLTELSPSCAERATMTLARIFNGLGSNNFEDIPEQSAKALEAAFLAHGSPDFGVQNNDTYVHIVHDLLAEFMKGVNPSSDLDIAYIFEEWIDMAYEGKYFNAYVAYLEDETAVSESARSFMQEAYSHAIALDDEIDQHEGVMSIEELRELEEESEAEAEAKGRLDE